jgi:curved DNA-binding protein CbpA
VPPDADQAQIDSAYVTTAAKLEAGNRRGASDAAIELNLIREGYQILSDATQLSKYNAKLAAEASGVKLMFFPEDRASQRKLGVQTIVFALLMTVLGGVIYYQLSSKMNEVRIEHTQAVIRQKSEKDKAITVDTAQSEPQVASTAAPNQKP